MGKHAVHSRSAAANARPEWFENIGLERSAGALSEALDEGWGRAEKIVNEGRIPPPSPEMRKITTRHLTR
jgi:hypothetical protein